MTLSWRIAAYRPGLPPRELDRAFRCLEPVRLAKGTLANPPVRPYLEGMKGTQHQRIRTHRNRDTGWNLGARRRDTDRTREPGRSLPETRLQVAGRRYYSPELGRWISRDPIGVIGGSCLFGAFANDPMDAYDVLGLAQEDAWERIGSTSLYTANRDTDLKALARQVGRPSTDSVCIWPIGPRKPLWKKWPSAKQCAVANAHNLLAKSGPELRMMPRNAGGSDQVLVAFAWMLGGQAVSWTSGEDAAETIKSVSHQGLTPIHTFYVGGHHAEHGSAELNGNMGPPDSDGVRTSAPFEAADLKLVADVPDDAAQTYEFAHQAIGPPKCWFTTTADVWGIGCWTANTWMGDWASKVMRRDSTVHGTRHRINRSFTGQMGWVDDEGVLRQPTGLLGKALQWKTWTKTPGMN